VTGNQRTIPSISFPKSKCGIFLIGEFCASLRLLTSYISFNENVRFVPIPVAAGKTIHAVTGAATPIDIPANSCSRGGDAVANGKFQAHTRPPP